jgi:hypothetical protein
MLRPQVVSRGLSVGFALSYTSAIVSLFIGLSKMKGEDASALLLSNR